MISRRQRCTNLDWATKFHLGAREDHNYRTSADTLPVVMGQLRMQLSSFSLNRGLIALTLSGLRQAIKCLEAGGMEHELRVAFLHSSWHKVELNHLALIPLLNAVAYV
jgi:hypothetical protein